VVAVGPVVARFSAGDEVYGIAAPHGSFAEYAAAREDKLARKPGNLSRSNRPLSFQCPR
jgi:NADPH:quinone reductase-like Zn-dependent oxidoreductase